MSTDGDEKALTQTSAPSLAQAQGGDPAQSCQMGEAAQGPSPRRPAAWGGHCLHSRPGVHAGSLGSHWPHRGRCHMEGHKSLMTYLPARRVAKECEPHGKPNWS